MPHDDYHMRGEIDDVSIVIIMVFLFLFCLVFSSVLLLIPYAIIQLIDIFLLGSIMPWYLDIIATLCTGVLILFMTSTIPKNPITWYIYLRSPVIILYNRNPPGAAQRPFINEVENWIKENIKGQWRRSRNWVIGKIEYQFLQPSDAMAFKLKWT